MRVKGKRSVDGVVGLVSRCAMGSCSKICTKELRSALVVTVLTAGDRGVNVTVTANDDGYSTRLQDGRTSHSLSPSAPTWGSRSRGSVGVARRCQSGDVA